MTKKIISKSEKQTEELGLKLAEELKPGTVIALIGDLGSGKTALTKALAKGLGIEEQVTSPTFTIIQEYSGGRLPLYHFDVYRLEGEEDMYELGYEDYFYGDGVCVVEWADRIKELLPKNTIYINIDYGSQENERIYNIKY
ncbi:MAG: tRNA (adenosine(37)-N6)-threonylcarbamoyltransferase complex ATPase subunit type 1 TsaE [Clostridiales bacterium]|jgi:tRNA threonylcarbamoyladenosine biosynthesis protein TsaE|nr:tRNA (adenosine(37)-N6)-threonylcarbamoyltransferase complex ATPase subunit type 1 TsaE [Clostridiales bacterium]